jgi:tRNA(Arg) A34 adenosine deaminase TadA
MTTLNSPEHYMALALQEAHAALRQREPEVPVGCVFVHTTSGAVLAAAHNETNLFRDATRHAEIVAIDDIIVKQGMPADIIKSCDL